MNVALLGASDNPEKYSYLALKLLEEKGHRVFPVHPSLKAVEGRKVYAAIGDIPEPIDTVSLYVSSKVSSSLAGSILAKKPRRLIFNPGAENPDFASQASAAGVKTLDACTLVMLKTGQF